MNLIIFSLISLYLALPVLKGQVAISNSGPCDCDLTVQSCDNQCCCDSDCSDAQKASSGRCSNSENTITPSQFCIPKLFMFAVNSKFQTVDTQKNSIQYSCYINYQYTQFNSFSQPAALTITQIKKYSPVLDGLIRISPKLSEYLNRYTINSPIYLYFDDSVQIGKYAFPQPFNEFNRECNSQSVAKFLNDQTSSCLRIFSAAACAQKPSVQSFLTLSEKSRIIANRLFFNQPQNPANFGNAGAIYANNANLLQMNINCYRVGATATIDCNTVRNPTRPGGTNSCQNVVTKVHTTIYFRSNTFIIENVQIALSVATVTQNFMQENSINFIDKITSPAVPADAPIAAPAIVMASGTPGYFWGSNVQAGTLNTAQTQIARTNWNVLRGCSNNGNPLREPLKFGYNTQVVCKVPITNVNLANCENTHQRLSTILQGGSWTILRIAQYGDSSDGTPNDWMRMLIHPSSKSLDDTTDIPASQLIGGGQYCGRLPLSQTIQIAYASQGVRTNPQRKIIGVMLKNEFGPVQTADLVTVMIQQRVEFIDITTTPTQSRQPIQKSLHDSLNFDGGIFYPTLSDNYVA